MNINVEINYFNGFYIIKNDNKYNLNLAIILVVFTLF